MAASQTGVPGNSAVQLVALEARFAFATAPILLLVTMAQTAWDLGTKHKHATQDHVQVKYFSRTWHLIGSSNH